MPEIGELFHVGIRVPDFTRALDELAGSAGVGWARPQHRQQPVWLPGTGATTLDLHFTYSAAGPVHLEILQGPPGSIWSGHDVAGPHHLGYWVDSVAEVTERLVAAGWSLEAASAAPEDGYGAFTYVRSPAGILVEPVSLAVRPAFEAWWAGGDL
jgi:catechol 2,3-dioxygenase-like lactoylglutathione lyase family enzyme